MEKEKLFNTLRWGVWVVAALAVYGVFWGPPAQYARSLPPTRTVVVSGTGKAVGIPDKATVNFSVVSTGSNPAKVQEQNTKTMNDIIAYLKEQGMEEKDIKTSGYNLSPKYSYNQETGKSDIYGYELNQTVTVTVRDLGKVGTVIGGLGQRGINQIGSLYFEVENKDELLAQAREEAFAKAKEKAKEMASAAGVRLGKVVYFSESGGGTPPIYYGKAAGYGMGGDSVASPQIEAGSQEINVEVSVTYELK